MNCQHCRKELQSENFGEQRQTDIFRKWLCDITCIPWVVAHSGDPSPSCEQGQYGVIELTDSDLLTNPSTSNESYQNVTAVDEDGNPVIKHCCIMRFTERVTFDLRVFMDSGESTRCNEITQPDAPYRTDMDVLRHVRLMSFKEDSRKILNDQSVGFPRSGDMRIDRERDQRKDGRLCPRNAFMSVDLDFCTQASYPTDGSLFHWCVFTCEGRPLCFEKPTCEEEENG